MSVMGCQLLGPTMGLKFSTTAIERGRFLPIEDIYYLNLTFGINGNTIFFISS